MIKINYKKGDWLANTENLLYIIDIQDNKYTIKHFMKLVFGTLFIANDSPKRKFQWNRDSMGLQEATYDCKDFIKHVFNCKIVYTELNKD